MSRRLYCATLVEGKIALSPEESHHAATVLRLKSGDEVVLFNGKGREAVGTVDGNHHRQVGITVTAIREGPFELSRQVTIAVAMPRAHRQGYLIEKCTELGVAAIWPIRTERSVVIPRSATIGRWKRRAIEAAKQSGRNWIPEIAEVRDGAKVLGLVGQFDVVGIAHPDELKQSCERIDLEPPRGLEPATRVRGRTTHDPTKHPSDRAFLSLGVFLQSHPSARTLLVLIGPEGGWDPCEVDQAVEAGATLITLGNHILRTETAAVAVCAAVALAEPS